MSPSYLENCFLIASDGTLVLERNSSQYPMIIKSPFDFKYILKSKYGISAEKGKVEDFAKNYYSKIKVSRSKESHVSGCFHVLDFLGKKEDGYAAWEAKIMQRGKIRYAPDIVFHNGCEEIIEIQGKGTIDRDKYKVLKSMRKNIKDAEISVGIPAKQEYIKNLKKSLGRFPPLKDIISFAYVFRPTLDEFCKGNIAKKYELSEFSDGASGEI